MITAVKQRWHSWRLSAPRVSRGIRGDQQLTSRAVGQAGVKAHWKVAHRLSQLIKFCLVGGSGLVVDMSVLHLLACPAWCGWDPTLSKVFAAEAALLNNFFWNEVWTFGAEISRTRTVAEVTRRLWRFHAICGVGLGWAVAFINLFYAWLGLNLYVANLLAIGLVTLWNFWLNARFNWAPTRASGTSR